MSEQKEQTATTMQATARELYEALKECSFRLATVVAAHADFSDANAKALDQAWNALQKAHGSMR